jgi:predicted small secreted protein
MTVERRLGTAGRRPDCGNGGPIHFPDMTKSAIILAVSLGALLLSACNTTRGIGRDVKSVGGAIERAVD